MGNTISSSPTLKSSGAHLFGELDNDIKLQTSSRNGQFSTPLSSQKNPSLAPRLEMDHSARKLFETLSLTHRQTFCGISTEYPSPGPAGSDNLRTFEGS